MWPKRSISWSRKKRKQAQCPHERGVCGISNSNFGILMWRLLVIPLINDNRSSFKSTLRHVSPTRLHQSLRIEHFGHLSEKPLTVCVTQSRALTRIWMDKCGRRPVGSLGDALDEFSVNINSSEPTRKSKVNPLYGKTQLQAQIVMIEQDTLTDAAIESIKGTVTFPLRR